MIFGGHSGIVENDILPMQIFLDVSRFLYSGGLAGMLLGEVHTAFEPAVLSSLSVSLLW